MRSFPCEKECPLSHDAFRVDHVPHDLLHRPFPGSVSLLTGRLRQTPQIFGWPRSFNDHRTIQWSVKRLPAGCIYQTWGNPYSDARIESPHNPDYIYSVRQIKLAIFGVLAVHALLPAQPTYLFLRNDVPARTAALGGSFVSMQNDPNILFVNPAGLTTLEHDAVSVSYLDHLMDIGAGSFAYAGTWEPIGPFAVGITYYHYGQFDETDASTNVYGTFSAVDLAVCAGTARSTAEK